MSFLRDLLASGQTPPEPEKPVKEIPWSKWKTGWRHRECGHIDTYCGLDLPNSRHVCAGCGGLSNDEWPPGGVDIIAWREKLGPSVFFMGVKVKQPQLDFEWKFPLKPDSDPNLCSPGGIETETKLVESSSGPNPCGTHAEDIK